MLENTKKKRKKKRSLAVGDSMALKLDPLE